MKIKFTFLLAVLLFIFGSAFSDDISLFEAERVAKNFLYEQTGVNQGSIELISNTFEKNSITYYYIFNVKSGGFVIVSAEDSFDPIIAFSLEHEYVADNQPANYQWWMNTYVEKIDYCVQNNITTVNAASLWSHFNVAHTDFVASTIPKTEVLLTTALWNQSAGWNDACPEDVAGPGGHALAGCVATAMAIVMKYYEYPVHGTGTYEYYQYPYGTISADFGNTNYMWEYMDDENHNWYVANLMYHAGVAVHMTYGSEGSGAYSYNVPDALSYFEYDDAEYMSKGGYTTWINTIQDQLDNDHPVYYSGQSDEGGHAFVCDGYRTSDDYFHFNFGWSGSSNGWYSHTDVNGFSDGQAIIKDFYPTDAYYPYNTSSVQNLTAELDTFNLDNFTVDIAWDAPTSKALTGYDLYRGDELIAEDLSVGTTSFTDTDADANDYFYGVRAIYSDGITQCTVDDVEGLFNVGFVVSDENGVGIHMADVTFNGVELQTGFGSVSFNNIPFGQDYDYTATDGNYTVNGTIDYLYKNMTIYLVLSLAGINETNNIIVAYPNPTNGILFLSGLNAENLVNVFDMNGKKVFSQNNVINDTQIDLTNLSSGIYNVQILSGSSTINHQIIIK